MRNKFFERKSTSMETVLANAKTKVANTANTYSSSFTPINPNNNSKKSNEKESDIIPEKVLLGF